VAIKVIVELHALPGRRGELRSAIEHVAADQQASEHGYLGSNFYEALDDPDLLIDIAEWESAEARQAHLAQAAASGAYAPVMELLAAPVRATVIRRLT
jgi:quinol monooxygenase YgiN